MRELTTWLELDPGYLRNVIRRLAFFKSLIGDDVKEANKIGSEAAREGAFVFMPLHFGHH